MISREQLADIPLKLNEHYTKKRLVRGGDISTAGQANSTVAGAKILEGFFELNPTERAFTQDYEAPSFISLPRAGINVHLGTYEDGFWIGLEGLKRRGEDKPRTIDGKLAQDLCQLATLAHSADPHGGFTRYIPHGKLNGSDPERPVVYFDLRSAEKTGRVKSEATEFPIKLGITLGLKRYFAAISK